MLLFYQIAVYYSSMRQRVFAIGWIAIVCLFVVILLGVLRRPSMADLPIAVMSISEGRGVALARHYKSRPLHVLVVAYHPSFAGGVKWSWLHLNEQAMQALKLGVPELPKQAHASSIMVVPVLAYVRGG